MGMDGGVDAGRDAPDDLDGLFPAGVACVSCRSGGDAALFPEESLAAARFAPRRLAEFRHGRACARRALLRLGAGPAAIGVGSHREPLWPEGLVGSISHAGELAAAAVARCRDFRAIGLDVETTPALDAALLDIVCRPEERRRLGAAGIDAGLEALLVFSAKEAVYKALWPEARQFIDFQDVEVHLDPGRGEFRAIARGPACPGTLAAAIRGRVLRRPGCVAAGAWIEAAEPGPGSAWA